MNLKPYETFVDLKLKHDSVMVELASSDIELHASTFPKLEDYVRFLYKKKGIQIDRYRHDYASLDTPHPKLGVVFLASDEQTINPTMEAWVLIGHNATTVERIQSDL